jgi:predicted RNase H-like nuclease (RuvC/YqgF family)
MADDGGGGSAEWLPLFDRVEAQVEALAADRARLEAADRVQRVSWEAARRLQRSVEELQAAARDKDAEIERLRAEAADARKKLQVVCSRPSCIPLYSPMDFDLSGWF